MAKNWSPNKRKLIQWLATPEMDRDPINQRRLAEKLGVHEVTLSEWKHDPELIAEVNALVETHLADDYSEAVASLKREMRKGSYNHLKLYFEMIGKYVPKVAPTTPDGERPYTAQDLTDDQLARIAAVGIGNTPGGSARTSEA